VPYVSIGRWTPFRAQIVRIGGQPLVVRPPVRQRVTSERYSFCNSDSRPPPADSNRWRLPTPSAAGSLCPSRIFPSGRIRVANSAGVRAATDQVSVRREVWLSCRSTPRLA
jgi:hypothetical protein